MTKLLLPIAVALVQMTAAPAFAQPQGEADAAQAKSPPKAKVTGIQQAAARHVRKDDGREAARGPQMGEGPSRPEARPAMSREERKAAAARRLDANRAANKAGEFSRGGNVDAPEKQAR